MPASASNALACNVASIVSGAPVKSMRIFAASDTSVRLTTDCALTVASDLERRGDHRNLQGQPGQGDNTHRPGLVPPQPAPC